VGFSYRKSFKAGPIRVTASKSGVSYSAGIKGDRVTKRADGRTQTTLSAPGTGLRYTSTTGSSKPTATRAATRPDQRAIEAAYREVYPQAVQALRDGHSGAEIRGALHTQGATHPRILKAVTDAERYLSHGKPGGRLRTNPLRPKPRASQPSSLKPPRCSATVRNDTKSTDTSSSKAWAS
jgi:hypothetical protein